MKRVAIIAAAFAMTATSAVAGETPAAIETLENTGFRGKLARSGDLFVAGQPDESGLARMAEAGVTTVINRRTPSEMEAVPFDQAAAVERLGMRYVHVPQGGSEFPATPEALDQVAAAMKEADGKPVLLHCASSGRASHMFAAWLHREGDVPLDKAVKLARKIGFGSLRVEGLLDTQFEMHLPKTAEQVAEQASERSGK